MRTAYAEAVRGRRSAVYKPGVGWVGSARRRPGLVTKTLIITASITVGVVLFVVMTGAPRP